MIREAALDPFLESFVPVSIGTSLEARFRKEAWEKLQSLSLPHEKSDAFQYFTLRPYLQKRYTSPHAVSPTVKPLPETGRSFIAFVNGALRLDLSSLEALPKGCVVKPLSHAAKSYATLISNRFSSLVRQEKNPFSLLTMASYGGGEGGEGLFVYIPPNTVLDAPIEILSYGEGDEPSYALSRVMVVVGAHAQATFVTSHRYSKAKELFHSFLFDCSLEEGAHLHVVESALDAGSGVMLSSLRAALKRSSVLTAKTLSRGRIPSRFDAHVTLLGEGAEASLSGLSLTSREDQSHTDVLVEHTVPNTRSNQLFKAALTGASRVSFQGKIFVHKEAVKTEAYQLSSNLLLSDSAFSASKPNLEIFADDVKASHGSTTGQLNEEELFYLRTRGFSAKEAKAALIKGFCDEIVMHLPVASLQESVRQAVVEELLSEPSR